MSSTDMFSLLTLPQFLLMCQKVLLAGIKFIRSKQIDLKLKYINTDIILRQTSVFNLKHSTIIRSYTTQHTPGNKTNNRNNLFISQLLHISFINSANNVLF